MMSVPPKSAGGISNAEPDLDSGAFRTIDAPYDSDSYRQDACAACADLCFPGGSAAGPGRPRFRQWGKADLSAMERWVGAHSLHGKLQPCADYALFQHRLNGLTEEQSIALWRKLPAFTKGWAQRDIAGIVASSDPATALDRISLIFPAGQRPVMMGCALDIVVRKHPKMLLPWLEELAPVFYNEPAASVALFRLPAEDVSAELAKLTPKARGEISLEFMRHCLSQEHYARAEKLIAGVTEEPYKSMMDGELKASLKDVGIK